MVLLPPVLKVLVLLLLTATRCTTEEVRPNILRAAAFVCELKGDVGDRGACLIVYPCPFWASSLPYEFSGTRPKRKRPRLGLGSRAQRRLGLFSGAGERIPPRGGVARRVREPELSSGGGVPAVALPQLRRGLHRQRRGFALATTAFWS